MATASPTDRARALYRMGRYDLAAAELVPALADDPDYGDAHALLALCLENQGKLVEAERHANAAVAAWPEDAFCHYVRASVVKARGNARQAAASAREAVKLSPEFVAAWHLLSMIRLDQKDWRAAVACAGEGLALAPDDEGCATVRAAALLEMGYYDQANDSIERLLVRHPESGAAHALRGWYLLDRNDPHAAIAAFHEGLRLNPTASGAHGGLRQAKSSRNLVLRSYRRLERPFTKWIQRLPPYARPLGALVYAVLYVGLVWLGSTIMIFIFLGLVVLTGL
ncbi:MAG TPA: tetratricopeptide repeat protein [Longimicrobium sp.]|jgi:tetratricopeptide (TPR) repeat protein|uniref:tetratricopeptide repeat protein n=1 Tax=Longimicrobium sp. TaxID=2029185 RepID=UPI002EDA9B1E